MLGPELAGASGVAAFDPLRLTLDLHDTGRDARAVAAALRERAAIEPALADLPPPHRRARSRRRPARRRRALAAALPETLWTVPPGDAPATAPPVAPPGPALCTPRAAFLAAQERVPAEAAVGRIAAETLTPFPPGVPAVLPGECLVPDVIATLRAVADAGGEVRGAPDGLATFGVVAGAAPRGRWA